MKDLWPTDRGVTSHMHHMAQMKTSSNNHQQQQHTLSACTCLQCKCKCIHRFHGFGFWNLGHQPAQAPFLVDPAHSRGIPTLGRAASCFHALLCVAVEVDGMDGIVCSGTTVEGMCATACPPDTCLEKLAHGLRIPRTYSVCEHSSSDGPAAPGSLVWYGA